LALIAPGERRALSPMRRPIVRAYSRYRRCKTTGAIAWRNFEPGGFAPFFAQSLIDSTGVKRKSR
jgi:hypothetical protein